MRAFFTIKNKSTRSSIVICILCLGLLLVSVRGGSAMNFDQFSDIVAGSVMVPNQSLRYANGKEDTVAKGAENFIESMGERALAFLANDELSTENKSREFEKLLNDSFDMKTIARFALGRYYRTATKEQRSDYFKLFRKMIVDVYTQRFDEYSGQDFYVRSSRKDGERDTIVNSYITDASGAEFQVDWRVRYKEKRYQVVDVIVEGVSMSVTQRSEFSTLIQRGGGNLDVLITHLRSRG